MTTLTPNTLKSFRLSCRLFFTMTMVLVSSMATAIDDLNIAQKPLFLGGTDPNLLYILDNSGSMEFSYVPDSIGKDAYGSKGTTCSNNGFKRMSSSSYNGMYYDPAVTYMPPIKADGTSYPNASFTGAKPDGYSSSTTLVDLSSAYKGFWGNGSNGSTPGEECTYINTTASAAFYNTLKSSCIGQTAPLDACFDTVTVNSSSGPSRVRPELGGITSKDERTNFANWYSYYHKRLLTAKTGTSHAFAQSSTAINLGYMLISKTAIERGVRPFKDAFPASTDTFRTKFFSWLQGASLSGSTPLRRALDIAGQYYETSPEPYNSKPWDTGNGNSVSCRQSYTLLMTDGYWNSGNAGTTAATANTDSTKGGNDSLDGKTLIGYEPRAPFADGYSASQLVTSDGSGVGSLADVAMHYWKRDLRTTLTDNVATSSTSIDKAFWQHMTTFTIGFGITGSVDKTRAFNSITAVSGDADYGYPSQWPEPKSFNETRVDDLLHAGVNGHGGFFSAKNPTEFASALSNTLSSIASRSGSATSVSMNGTRLSSGSMVYQATFNSGDWSGDVLGYTVTPSTQALTLLAKASTGLPIASARKIYTWNPVTASGVLFQWDNLSTTASAATSASTATTAQTTRITDGITAALGSGAITGPQLVDYIRGDQSLEKTKGGILRNRSNVLGDLVNSDPVYTGKDDYGYASATSIPSTQRSSYATFVAAQIPMLYVGANDGMLHGFDGSNSSDALKEVFAYVPNNVIGNLPYLAKATDFNHKYFVDGPISVGHAYVNGSWKTVLVGATGAGGKTYFAIDVTTPSTPVVLWEYTHAELGNTLGKAAITRLPDGNWAAIFGNGYNSTSQKASLFIVNLANGNLIKKLDVASRDTALANGLATPIEADANRDGSTDIVYAGDLQGQMWKFNLSSTSNSAWAVSFGGKPLFQTPSKTVGSVTSYPQPITSQPQVARHPLGGAIVFFGTGKFFETADQSNLALQTYYGVRDECLLNTSTTANCGTLTSAKVLPSQLLAQTFTESTVSSSTIRMFSKNKDTSKKGWYVDLRVSGSSTETGERIIASSVLLDDRIIFSSIIPNSDVCGYGGTSWLFELDLLSGGATSFSVFDLDNDGLFTTADLGNARMFNSLIKTPSISAQNEGSGYTFTGTSDPGLRVDRINLKRLIGRQTWRQVR